MSASPLPICVALSLSDNGARLFLKSPRCSYPHGTGKEEGDGEEVKGEPRLSLPAPMTPPHANACTHTPRLRAAPIDGETEEKVRIPADVWRKTSVRSAC